MTLKALLHPPVRGPDAPPRDRAEAGGPATPRLSVAARRARWQLATDALMLATAGSVEMLSAPSAGVSSSPGWRLVFALLVLALLALHGRYRPTMGRQFLDQVRAIFSATAVAAMTITFVRVLFADQVDVAEEAIRFWVFALVYLMAGRAVSTIITERLNRFRQGGAPTLILGAGQVAHLVARRLLAHPELGLRPIGFVDPNPLEVEDPSGLPVLGSDQQVEQVVQEQGVEHAILAFYAAPHEAQLDVSRMVQRMNVSVSIVPRLFERMPDRITLERVGGLPLLSIYTSNPRDWRIALKYASDRAVALFAILVVSPLMLLAAAGTALTLGRPILFRQRRVGLDGREFEMLKFRTMRPAAPEDEEQSSRLVQEAIEHGLAPGGTEGSERLTRFGAFLRRPSLDELPQLFNVLQGEMSIVGPRPERPSYVAVFHDQIRRYDDRHQVKAGITGWAQVHGLRGDTSLEERIELDNYYIENWSPWLDLKILLLTAIAVLRGPAE